MSNGSFRMIGKFLARDHAGTTYEINEWQEFIETTTLDGTTDWLPGLKDLQLNSGAKVNWIDDDTFEIVSNGTILKRIT